MSPDEAARMGRLATAVEARCQDGVSLYWGEFELRAADLRAAEGLMAENAALKAQIADMQADLRDHWGGKVAVSEAEADRLNALPDLEGVKERLAEVADDLEEDVRDGGGTGISPVYTTFEERIATDRPSWSKIAKERFAADLRAALQALEAKGS